jgi:hypothetical protein
MIKCCACGKNIYDGKLINGDGDFVCDDKCEKKLWRNMETFCKMSDNQFNEWMNE